MSVQETIHALERLGFVQVRQRGSILRQAKVTPEEFMENL